MALVLTGCSGAIDAETVKTASGPVVGLTVSGNPGEVPSVRIVAPLEFSSTAGRVVVPGTGAPIEADRLFVLHLALYDARTGTKALSTYDTGMAPVVAKSSDGSLFPVLADALVGLRQGSRLVMAVSAADAFGGGGTPPDGVRREDPVVMIADVLAVPPTTVLDSAEGVPRAAADDGPSVVLENGDPIRVDPGKTDEPTEVTVVRLIEGTGPPVRSGSLVTLDLLAQEWGSRIPYESTYFKDPVVLPVGTQGAIPAWGEALVGLPRGSRVLVVAPAAQASAPGSSSGIGRGTITWVIDILGVS